MTKHDLTDATVEYFGSQISEWGVYTVERCPADPDGRGYVLRSATDSDRVLSNVHRHSFDLIRTASMIDAVPDADDTWRWLIG